MKSADFVKNLGKNIEKPMKKNRILLNFEKKEKKTEDCEKLCQKPWQNIEKP